MIKRIFASISAAAILATLTACSLNDSTDETETTTSAPAQVTQAAQTSSMSQSTTQTASDFTKSQTDIDSAKEFIVEMQKKINISDLSQKDASYIGAAEGYSFSHDGKAFELYKFTDKAELQKAKSGSYTFTLKGLESLGELTMSSRVNGDFVLLFEQNDTAVLTAFSTVR